MRFCGKKKVKIPARSPQDKFHGVERTDVQAQMSVEELHAPGQQTFAADERISLPSANEYDIIEGDTSKRKLELHIGVHAVDPPQLLTSNATSCAGMTDGGLDSRRECFSQESFLDINSPRPEVCAHSSRLKERNVDSEMSNPPDAGFPEAVKSRAPLDTASNLVKEKKHIHKSDVKTAKEAECNANGAELENPSDAELSNPVNHTIGAVRETFNRGCRTLRDGPVGTSIRRMSTGDFPELQSFENCLQIALNELTDFGERAMPCILGEHADDITEEGPLPQMQIFMTISTPGGPYLRCIPDRLVGDAISMGFITEDEVDRQRQAWGSEKNNVLLERSPETYFASQAAA